MTIRTINGFQIYAVTRNEVEYKPSIFSNRQKNGWKVQREISCRKKN